MNQKIANPFIVNITAPVETGEILRNGRRLYVPVNARWSSFTTELAPVQSDDYDSVIVHMNQNIPMDEPNMINSIQIKLNQVCRMATDVNKVVLNDTYKDAWYFLNPPYNMPEAHGYAPADNDVLAKCKSFETEQNWQKHQAEIWTRLADMMPLQNGKYSKVANHVAQLTSAERGLEPDDLKEFWSFHSGQILSPSIMGDDMVGMPGILGQEYEGFTLVQTRDSGVEVETPLTVRSLRTMGMSGIAIPMANVEGNVPKYQIWTDVSKINVALKARTKDGVSIQRSEYHNKKTDVYLFDIDGVDNKSNLRVQDAFPTGEITMSDAKGTFPVHMKEDIKPLLLERGYLLPPIIERLQVVPSAKYIWQSRGTMIGSEAVSKIVSPSNAGFVVGREPKNECKDYVVLVAEGALKGRIVAKYADVKDETGRSFGDEIAGDSGIIIAQVPGVAKAFVDSVEPVYKAYPVSKTLIAMDADGRDNLAVARGIKTAHTCLTVQAKNAKAGPVSVMSWNPEQKGLDDALLAVSQKKISISDMGLQYGTPEKLFPLDQAKAPNPYRMDGTRANRQEWQIEYDISKKEANQKIKEAQQETAKRDKVAPKVKIPKNPVLAAIQEETKQRAAKQLNPSSETTLQTRAETIKNGGSELQKELSDMEDGQTKESMQP